MTKLVAKTALSMITLGAVLALLQGTPAQALNNKSFVSGTGSDANNCSTVPQACATFAHALTQTAAGGEISVVNTGEYGKVTISKSVHITNDGAGEASILPSGAGIHIAAGLGDVISLRGLVVDGQGAAGTFGAFIETASAIHIQNCVIRNFEATGAFGISVVAGFNMKLFVSDTNIFNNGSTATSGGINITQFGTRLSIDVVLDRVHLENNVVGLLVTSLFTDSATHVIIRDAVVSSNAGDGIRAHSVPLSAAFLVVDHTAVVSNAGTGILAEGQGAIMLLNDNTITRNGAGISAITSGQLISYGNNKNNINIGPEGAPTSFFSQM